MTALLLDAGAECRQHDSPGQALADESVQLIVSAAVHSERARIGIAAMRNGKDFFCVKQAFTTLADPEEARRVSAEIGRICSVFFSERLDQLATILAGELVRAGAIGRMVHVTGLAPHRLHPPNRPAWCFSREHYGGILADLGSHQTDQFLHFTGCGTATVTAARITAGDRYPGFEDFGDTMLSGEGASGYFRVDWLSPTALSVWGDGRLFLLGTEGYIEVRKNCDIAGRDGSDHVFLVNGEGPRYMDASQTARPFAAQLLADIRDRTETAMTARHCFMACELALRAQLLADE